jgi:hypothetical protein
VHLDGVGEDRLPRAEADDVRVVLREQADRPRLTIEAPEVVFEEPGARALDADLFELRGQLVEQRPRRVAAEARPALEVGGFAGPYARR